MNQENMMLSIPRPHAPSNSKVTLHEILNTASQFELTAFTFYDALKDKVGIRLQPLVEALIHEEQSHLALFQELVQHIDVQILISCQISAPLHYEEFSNYIHLPRLEDFPDDRAILHYALTREKVAIEQYAELAVETPEGALRDLFSHLAQEEFGHKQELERRYEELLRHLD